MYTKRLKRLHVRQRVALVIGLVLSLGLMGMMNTAHATARSMSRRPPPRLVRTQGAGLADADIHAPSDADCRAQIQVPCYSPAEMRRAYELNSLIKDGYTGKGQSIVIIDSFGSPTALKDLKAFDKAFGLPDPPSFQVLAPLGSVPFDPTNNDQVGWAEETSLDVQWAHAIAPDANIVLLTSPVAETEGVQGLPEFLALEKYALDHHLGKIISQSWGATENTLFDSAGRQVLKDFESFYARAARESVTVFASSGDSGSAGIDVNNHNYPFPVVEYPASSPYVTAVGGTSLSASIYGNYRSEKVWNNDIGATGGGISQVFDEPQYQKDHLSQSTQKTLNSYRGMPDIAYNGDPDTGVLVYLGFFDAANNGFYIFGGTSAGAPQWAGIAAIANQKAGHPLGFLNKALYELGDSNLDHVVFHDTTKGNNAFDNIKGYDAMSGWDLSTGWGTPRGGSLIRRLIKQKQSDND